MSLFLALAEILFVGDGRLERTVPLLVEAGINHMGGSVTAAVDMIGGAPLEYNLKTPSSTDRDAVPPEVEALSELQKGETRALILSEGMPLAAIVDWHEPAITVATYAAVARAANPDVRVFLTETWHSLDSGVVIDKKNDAGSDIPWRERIEIDGDIWRAIAAKASEDSFGGEITVIPAGQAIGRLADEIAAGRVPGISRIEDLFKDNKYPNGRGAYFIAMVELAALTGKSPEGLPARLLRSWPTRDWVLSDEQAAIFQRIAWEEVQAFDALPPLTIEASVSLPAETATVAVVATEIAEIPPAPVPDVIDLPGVANPSLIVGLAAVADWSTQLPFLDLMKSGRQWVGHLPDQWGGWGQEELVSVGALDDHGWPTRIPSEVVSLSTLVMTDMPSDSLGLRGRYVVRYQGTGNVKIEGIGRQVSSEPGRVLFDYDPGPGFVMVTIDATDKADPVRDITIVREDRVAAFDAGEIFNPEWLARLRGVKGVRFMDWMATNNSGQSRFEDRPEVDDYTWTEKGVPVEIMVALSNALDADPWFTLPHMADDDYVRRFAEIVRDGLETDRQVWAEFSNEVWNWQFYQAAWAEEQGMARWGEKYKWVEYYALRATEVAAIWTEVFGKDAEARLVRVISTQTGYRGLESQILDAEQVIAEGKPPPAQGFDAYAITGYFAANLGQESKVPIVRGWIEESVAAAEAAAAEQGLSGDAAVAYVAQHRFDAAIPKVAEELRDGRWTGDTEDTLLWNTTRVFPYQAKVAKDHGLQLVMYEGGSHVVGIGGAVDDPLLTDFFTAFNYSPEMGAMYQDLMKGWARVTDAPFNQFFDIGNPSKWGSWGAMRHLGDTNPRWDALAAGCDGC